MTASKLEAKFTLLWKICGGPPITHEHKFHPGRRWRADFAHIESMTLIEIEGGTWTNGRHTRGSGFSKDCEKYLEATLAGWRVIRLTGDQITLENVCRIACFCTK